MIEWISADEFELAPEKAEAIVITQKRNRNGMKFKVERIEVSPKKIVKFHS